MTAKAAGFKMPPEDAPHERTFMQWPSVAKIYGGRRYLEETQAAITTLANAIADFEPVVMVADAEHATHLKAELSGAVEHWDIPTEDLWCRDAGPCFVVSDNGELTVADFNFNGWGGKQSHTHDGLIARKVAERMGLRHFDTGVVGEAGGLETDGEGTVIAHESSWVNPNRNIMSRDEIEQRILDGLGAEKMIWAPGLKGEDITDYHIDALARFVTPGRIVIQLPDAVDPDDPFSIAARETFEILRAAIDAEGRALDITVLPEPIDIRGASEEFVASYVNYYVCNGAVIAAQFGDEEADEIAAATLGNLYPGREIVMLNVDPIGEAGGGIHCATQQQPKV